MEFELPPPSALAWMVREYAQLRAEHGEVIGDPELVLPNDAFFPDPVTASAEGVNTLLRRTMTYAPLAEDLRVSFDFVRRQVTTRPAAARAAAGGCGSGGGASPARLGARERKATARTAIVVSLSTADAGDPAQAHDVARARHRRPGPARRRRRGGRRPRPSRARRRGHRARRARGLRLVRLQPRACGGARVHQGTALVSRRGGRAARALLPRAQGEAVAGALAAGADPARGVRSRARLLGIQRAGHRDPAHGPRAARRRRLRPRLRARTGGAPARLARSRPGASRGRRDELKRWPPAPRSRLACAPRRRSVASRSPRPWPRTPRVALAGSESGSTSGSS